MWALACDSYQQTREKILLKHPELLPTTQPLVCSIPAISLAVILSVWLPFQGPTVTFLWGTNHAQELHPLLQDFFLDFSRNRNIFLEISSFQDISWSFLAPNPLTHSAQHPLSHILSSLISRCPWDANPKMLVQWLRPHLPVQGVKEFRSHMRHGQKPKTENRRSNIVTNSIRTLKVVHSKKKKKEKKREMPTPNFPD